MMFNGYVSTKMEMWLDAAHTGNMKIIQELVESGFDINSQVYSFHGGKAAIHWAAYSGNYDLLELLLTLGCNVNQKDSFGWTGLHYAAHRNYLPIVHKLMMVGADPFIEEATGKTPLDLAKQQSHQHIADYLRGFSRSLTMFACMWLVKSNISVVDHLATKTTRIARTNNLNTCICL
jgi:hypothetical protein